MPPLTAILLWNNRELFGKGGKINTPSVDYPPAILGPLDPVCSEHQRPVRDVGLKGGDAQFNQTFGCLCVQGHEPPSQRIRTFGGEQKKPKKTMWGHRHLWSKETFAISVFEDTGSASDWTATKKKEKKKTMLLGDLKREKSNWFAHHRKYINPTTPGRKA